MKYNKYIFPLIVVVCLLMFNNCTYTLYSINTKPNEIKTEYGDLYFHIGVSCWAKIENRFYYLNFGLKEKDLKNSLLYLSVYMMKKDSISLSLSKYIVSNVRIRVDDDTIYQNLELTSDSIIYDDEYYQNPFYMRTVQFGPYMIYDKLPKNIYVKLDLSWLDAVNNIETKKENIDLIAKLDKRKKWYIMDFLYGR